MLSAQPAVRAVMTGSQMERTAVSTMTDPISTTHFAVTDIAGPGQVVGGVDTHLDTHTAACVDHLGRLLAHAQFPATAAGEKQLLAWLGGFGELAAVGVEGTGSYGASLARLLTAGHVRVVEVSRPNRQTRRQRGKSDPLDAEAAARAVLAGTATGTPKTRTGVVESIRVLRTARSGAVKARTAATNTLKHVVVTAPEALRTQLAGLNTDQLVDQAAALRPTAELTDPVQTTKIALRRLARRCQHLTEEITDADTQLRALTAQTAPALLERCGVGPETAGQLLTTAGDNPHRLHSNAAFAALCGTSPSPSPPDAPTASASTAAATATPTPPCTPSRWSACATTNPPAPTSPDAAPKAKPPKKSCAASNAPSAANSSPSSNKPSPPQT